MDESRIEESQVCSLNVVRRLLPWREQLASNFGTTHGNASLPLIDVLIVMLAAFYNPMIRSQRLIEALSQQEWMKGQTAVGRVARSTLSDALKRFDPQVLHPLIAELTRRVPALGRRDADLAGITRQILAADGSYFNLAGEVVWALTFARGPRKPSQKAQSRVRLNLQLDVERFIPVEADVSGAGDGSEAKAFQRQLRRGVIYLVDRNFVNWGFLQDILAHDSNFVVRLRKDVGFGAEHALPLCAQDVERGVRSDDLGHLTGPRSASNEGRPRRTGPVPVQTLRRVVIWNADRQEFVQLLTDLLDVPAYVIATLYRLRWQIELFLRWFKCWANMAHLISQSPQGVTFQFYVAIIATLLLHLATGTRVSKYALFWLGSVASGLATYEQMCVGLARIEREKALARARLARKRQMKKLV